MLEFWQTTGDYLLLEYTGWLHCCNQRCEHVGQAGVEFETTCNCANPQSSQECVNHGKSEISVARQLITKSITAPDSTYR